MENAIFTSMKNHKNQPNVGEYTIHGSYEKSQVTFQLACFLVHRLAPFLRKLLLSLQPSVPPSLADLTPMNFAESLQEVLLI